MAAQDLQLQKKPVKILAVDDEEEILKLYELFLKQEGYEVTVVDNAVACMEYLSREYPNIILLDVNMPGIDGLRLLEMIRTTKAGSKIPIMMISARRDEKTIKAAALLGCDSFVIKPFNLKELAKRIAFEVVHIDAEYVMETLKHIRLHKNSLLHQPGLGAFDGLLYDCYPFTREEFEFCIVVPRGLRPQALLKLKPEELKDKIKFFCKRTLRWRQIWP